MLKQHQARAQVPILLIHGGAGSYQGKPALLQRRRSCLQELIDQLWPALNTGARALDVVYQAVHALEANALFNAGRGAALQQDGMARLSASLMDGTTEKFSGVQLVTHLWHPSDLAYALQSRQESVLGPFGAQLLARELGIKPQSPVTAEKAEQWQQALRTAPASPDQGDTVGAVALDRHGHLAAATSTGGGGCNGPDRMSDSATVAGNYATGFAAISCTGIGEQIVDDGLAVRLETRIRDGQSLEQAAEAAWREAKQRKRNYGWIALDRHGSWCLYATGEMPAVARSS